MEGTARQRQLADVVRQLAVLQRLGNAALSAKSLRELRFIVCNRTVELTQYDRAQFWDWRRRLRCVSGVAGVPPASGAIREWRKVLSKLPEPGKPIIFAPEAVPQSSGGKGPPGHALWLPLFVDGQKFGGLLLQRYGRPWDEEDIKRVMPVIRMYEGAFRIFAGGGRWGRIRSWLRPVAALAAIAALAAAFVLVRLPLRIVAPCEVVASRPIPVNAPIDGVIAEILVRPGQDVGQGQELYVFDGDVAREELEVATRQVELARRNLERAASLAVSDRALRAEAGLLENKLEQERIRLEAARMWVDKLRVVSPEEGTVIMGEPDELLGKPVRLGEAVLVIADRRDNRLRIWLPQDDRIDFRPELGITIFLHADAGRSRDAELTYVAAHAQAGMDDIYGFLAEAVWRDPADSDARLGLKGTAVLYGDEVSLGYWLFRKPLAAVRRFLGV